MKNISKVDIKGREYDFASKQPDIGMSFVNKSGVIVTYIWPESKTNTEASFYLNSISKEIERYKGCIEGDIFVLGEEGELNVIVADSEKIQNIERLINKNGSNIKAYSEKKSLISIMGF